jgi:hypothetical protein
LAAGKEPRCAGQEKTKRAFSQRARDALDIHSFFASWRFRISWRHARVSDGSGALDWPAIRQKTPGRPRIGYLFDAGNSYGNEGIYL